jgi:hypothetical protein
MPQQQHSHSMLSEASYHNMTVGRIPSVEGGIQPTIFDAKGDLLTATANDTPARLAVGANNRVLMADSTAATGLKYGGNWISYTPTFTNLTVGNGTVTGVYNRIGDVVYVVVRLNWGSTTSITGGVAISNPVNADADYEFLGDATFWAIGTSGVLSPGKIWGIGAGSSGVYVQNTSGTYTVLNEVTNTVPFTWATGNIFRLQFQFKAA